MILLLSFLIIVSSLQPSQLLAVRGNSLEKITRLSLQNSFSTPLLAVMSFKAIEKKLDVENQFPLLEYEFVLSMLKRKLL